MAATKLKKKNFLYRNSNHQHINLRDLKNMAPCKGIKYLCRQCGKQFSQKGHLARHKRALHEGVKYPCGQCGLQFSQKGYLARHHRLVHKSQ